MEITRNNCIKNKKWKPWFVLESSVFNDDQTVKEQISVVREENYVFMFKDFQWTVSVYLSIHFLGTIKNSQQSIQKKFISSFRKGFLDFFASISPGTMVIIT